MVLLDLTCLLGPRLDLAGMAISLPSIVMLLIALQWGGARYGWGDARIIGLFAGAGVDVVIFPGVEMWQQDRGLVPPQFFRDRNVLCAMMFALFYGASFFPMVYYMGTYFEKAIITLELAQPT